MRVISIAFALGVLLLQTQGSLPPWSWPILTILATGGGAAAWRLARLGRVGNGPPRCYLAWALLAGFAAIAGFAWSGWRAESALAHQLAPADEGHDFIVTGIVTSMPQSTTQGLRFELDVEALEAAGLVPNQALPRSLPRRLSLGWWRPRAAGRADVAGEGNVTHGPAVHAGERWRMTVRLKRPHGLRNPGGFDAEAWMLERGIDATGTVRLAQERLSAFVIRPDTTIERLREAVRDRFLATLPAADYPWGGVLAALAVGDQRAVDTGQWRIFARTGTTHLMSISGLHVTLVAGLVAFCAGALWRRHPRAPLVLATPRAAALAGTVGALLYTLLAGSGVPALRTLTMVAVASLAVVAGRVTRVGRVLATALLAVLLLDPWAVLAPGFWLSYGVPRTIMVPVRNG